MAAWHACWLVSWKEEVGEDVGLTSSSRPLGGRLAFLCGQALPPALHAHIWMNNMVALQLAWSLAFQAPLPEACFTCVCDVIAVRHPKLPCLERNLFTFSLQKCIYGPCLPAPGSLDYSTCPCSVFCCAFSTRLHFLHHPQVFQNSVSQFQHLLSHSCALYYSMLPLF